MYRNGTKIPDQQEVSEPTQIVFIALPDILVLQFFGFPDPRTREGTKLIREADVEKEIGRTLDQLASTGPLLLVLHGADTEVAYFREFLSPGIDKWKAEVPANLYTKDREGKYPIVIQDTQRLYAAYKEEPEHATTVLHSACTNEGIPCHKILNAGVLIFDCYDLAARVLTYRRQATPPTTSCTFMTVSCRALQDISFELANDAFFADCTSPQAAHIGTD